jgi:hypothetical protein
MSTVSVELSKLAPKLSGNLKVNRKKQSVNNLVAILHGTVRMSEWEYLDRDNAFVFFSDKNKKLSIRVTPELVEVRKGIRNFPIGNGKDASTLFSNLKHVKAVIAKAQAEHQAGESSVNALLSEALDDLTNGNDAVTADDLHEDIHIPNAPALVDPIEVTLESEEVAGALENQMEREDDPLIRTKEALEEPETELGEALFGSDDPEDDVFSEVLGGKPQTIRELVAAKPKVSIRLHKDVTEEDGKKMVDSIASHLSGPIIGSLKSLQGRVLGIVDASFADKTQREAVKTLINKEFRREMDKF